MEPPLWAPTGVKDLGHLSVNAIQKFKYCILHKYRLTAGENAIFSGPLYLRTISKSCFDLAN